MFRLGVAETPFFDIALGTKTIEIRCWKNPFTPIARIYEYAQANPGTIFPIEFILKNVARTEKRVVRTTFYPSIRDALEAEGVANALPGRAETVDEGVEVYRQYYTEAAEVNGCIALKLL